MRNYNKICLKQRLLSEGGSLLDVGADYRNLKELKLDAGAQFLSVIRSEPTSASHAEDRIHDIALGTCPAGAGDLLALVIDDPDILLAVPPHQVLVQGVTVLTMLAQVVYWEVAVHLAWLWKEYVSIYEKLGDVDEALYQCGRRQIARCGDTGGNDEFAQFVFFRVAQGILEEAR